MTEGAFASRDRFIFNPLRDAKGETRAHDGDRSPRIEAPGYFSLGDFSATDLEDGRAA